MPSWLVHAAFAYVISTAFGFRKRSVCVLGGVAPDFSYALLAVVYLFSPSAAQLLMLPFHTFVGALVVGAGMLQFFDGGIRRNWLPFTVGVASHILLDDLMFPHPGLHHFLAFWPISWVTYGVEIQFFGLLQIVILVAAASVALWESYKARFSKKRLGD